MRLASSIFCCRAGLAGLALVLSLGLGGCKGNVYSSEATEQARARRAVATVNGEQIGFDAYQDAYQRLLTRWEHFVREDAEARVALKRLLLARMIDELLLDQQARRQGIQVSEEQVREEAQQMLSARQVGAIFSAVSLARPDWLKALRRRLTHTRLIEQEVTASIHISKAEVRAYYRRNTPRFRKPEQVRALHICLKTRKLHDALWQQLSRGGNFARLAAQHSCTPDGAQGGDLGYQPKDVLPPAFDKVIFNLRARGQLSSRSKPLQTPMGYHLFRLAGRKPAHTLTLRQATPQILEHLRQQKHPAAYQEWLEDLRRRAAIHIDETLLRAV